MDSETEKNIVECLKNGTNQTEILKRFKIGSGTLRNIIKNKNINVYDYKDTKKNKIKEMISNGYSYKQIAEELNWETDSVRKQCKKLGINQIKTDEAIAEEFNLHIEEAREKYLKDKTWEYVSGFKTIDEHSIFKCKFCGAEKELSWVSFRKNNRKSNPACNECKRKKIEDFNVKSKAEAEEQKRLKNIERKRRGKQVSMIFCQCGNLASINSNFCKECNKNAANSRHEHKRRLLTNNQMVDKDISLKRLAKRDNQLCCYCNKEVDWNDKIKTDKAIICGNAYPSIEHIIPLSKGGLHSWENVKLAHRGCNCMMYVNVQRFYIPLGKK